MRTLSILVEAKNALLTIANGSSIPGALASQLAERLTAALNAHETFGLPIEQEPKYTTDPITGLIVNRASGVLIPRDEPIMIFRAKDTKARPTVRRYVDLVNEDDPSSHHRNVCFERYQQFVAFAEQHPERMKEPDTARAP